MSILKIISSVRTILCLFSSLLTCSEETKMKIGVGVRLGWQRRREKLMLQETCHHEWRNLIAVAARKGLLGEEELQWDSYKVLNRQLDKEWLQSIEQRKNAPKTKGSKRAPKSAEQKRKISQAIAAKWADPVRSLFHTSYVDLLESGCYFRYFMK